MNAKAENLRIGVIGVGSMGRHHIRIVSQTQGVESAGLFDSDEERAKHFCTEYGCTAYEKLDDLLKAADAVIIAAPTTLHAEIGMKCFSQGVHVLMEKPLAHNVKEASQLVDTAKEHNAILMVGHVERFNPAVQKLFEVFQTETEEIVSIDAQRLMPFDGSRCMDVDVLSDLLIHDVDLALEIADSNVRKVSAAGRAIFSTQIDTAHTRIEFENGAYAVFWTGKCSAKKARNITVATRSRCYEADTLTPSLTVYSADQIPENENGICFMTDLKSARIELPDQEPLRAELEEFIDAVRARRSPLIDGKRGLRGMQVLELVRSSIIEQKEIVNEKGM